MVGCHDIGRHWHGTLIASQSRVSAIGSRSQPVCHGSALPFRWGRQVLIVSSIILLSATAALWIGRVLAIFNGVDIINPGASSDVSTIASRQEIWTRVIYAIQDFSFSGIGLGTFDGVIPLLYPFFTIPPGTPLGHAHNFFLQMALDFGIPGLIALLAIHLVALAQIRLLWSTPVPDRANLPLLISWRTWAIGFIGCLIAQAIQGQFDAVAMGLRQYLLVSDGPPIFHR